MNQAVEPNLTFATARVLLGWMDTEEALRVQHDGRADVEVSRQATERLRIARERIAARPSGVDQREAILPAPRELAPYVEELRNHPVMAETFAEGWSTSMVDLRRLCAVQSRVYTDRADERVRGVDANDLQAIASVALPMPNATSFPAFFDPSRNAWVLTSPDPNLTVAGNFGRQLGPDTAGFGFSVAMGRSFVKALEHNGRYFLSDGYHRAVAFLRRGITHIPALTRSLRDGEPLTAPHGMLPPQMYLGERPPQLADFLEDDVSLSVVLPLFRKIIIIQAIEVMA